MSPLDSRTSIVYVSIILFFLNPFLLIKSTTAYASCVRVFLIFQLALVRPINCPKLQCYQTLDSDSPSRRSSINQMSLLPWVDFVKDKNRQSLTSEPPSLFQFSTFLFFPQLTYSDASLSCLSRAVESEFFLFWCEPSDLCSCGGWWISSTLTECLIDLVSLSVLIGAFWSKHGVGRGI